MWEATFFFEATFYPWGRGVILVKSFLFTNRSCVASALGQCFHSVSQTFLLIIFQHQERYTSSSYLMEEEWESVDNPTKSFNPTGSKMRPEKREKVRNGRGGVGGGCGERTTPALSPTGSLLAASALTAASWTAFTSYTSSFLSGWEEVHCSF